MRSERYHLLESFDDQLRDENEDWVLVGADEAGRGPLAGPVFAAAVCLPRESGLYLVNDSKKLSPVRRAAASRSIEDEAICFAVAMATAKEIDSMNIRQASLLAIRRASMMLSIEHMLVAVDGRDCLGHNFNSRAIIRGDSRSLSIAAASILAKTARDKYMTKLEEELPGYGFARHKGYPTAEHVQAIKRLGPSMEHRVTFKGVLP